MNDFSKLFKKYRLRSEIDTLAEFGDLLAQEGFVYDTSLFTKWQSSERIPKDRQLLIAIIRLFMKLGGIHTLEECNEICSSVNQKNLSESEVKSLANYFTNSNSNLNLPSKKIVFYYASPLGEKFDDVVSKVYEEIEFCGYIHNNFETQTHRLRQLMKKVDNGEDEELMEYKIIIQGFLENIKKADICVFETSARTLGTGYFIHNALTLSKPTVILYYKNNKPHLFSAVVDERIILKSYNEKNLKKVITRVLEVAQNKL